MDIVKDDAVTPEDPMEIVKDDAAAPARLGIKDLDDENEETIVLTIEEAQKYILSKVKTCLKDPEINVLLGLKNKINTLKDQVKEQDEELVKLQKMFDNACRDQVRFLRHIGAMPKPTTKTVGVSVNLPWLPESVPGVVNEDMLKKTGSSRVFVKPMETASKILKKESNEPIECIDLTDDADDDPGPSNSTTSCAVSSPGQTNPSTPILKTLQHPAPLPAVPEGINKSKVPPKPKLQISVDKNGIVLQWDLPPEAQDMKIIGFEIFGYQEKNTVPISSAVWKKIGCVDPMALPMSCTLTQFVEGFKYHFSIRAIGKDDNFGHFSDPASIMFMPEINS